MDEPGNEHVDDDPEVDAGPISTEALGDDPDGDETSEESAKAAEERDVLERILSLLGPRIDDARSLVDDLSSRWRGDAQRITEGTRSRVQSLLHDLGIVTEEQQDELELRVAQLEHRLRLLEKDTDESKPTAAKKASTPKK
jgi:hypothetical protein